MAKRLKLKLSRVIPSLHFCRSKRRSAFAETPLPAIYRLSPVNPKAFEINCPNNLPVPPPSTPEHRFIKRNLSSKAISFGCSCRSGSCTQTDDISSSPEYSWRNKEAARWSVVSGGREAKRDRKIYDASSDDGVSLVWVKQHTKTRRNKLEKRRVVASVSSRASGCFSSEEEADDETETLVSNSRSFSDDSFSELDRSIERSSDGFFNSENKPKKIKKVNTNIKKIRRLRRYASKKTAVASPDKESPVRTSVLTRMMIPCTVEGKVRESVAVVKKSVDPYDDFKRSMWEMILEKQMFEAKDLEQLLHCFLSLNSRQHHGTIVEAFSEIWEVLFCDFPVKCGARVRKAV